MTTERPLSQTLADTLALVPLPAPETPIAASEAGDRYFVRSEWLNEYVAELYDHSTLFAFLTGQSSGLLAGLERKNARHFLSLRIEYKGAPPNGISRYFRIVATGYKAKEKPASPYAVAYHIKPLEWVEDTAENQDYADTAVGTFTVGISRDRFWWSLGFDNGYCKSLAAAKAHCEALYLSRVQSLLTPAV